MGVAYWLHHVFTSLKYLNGLMIDCVERAIKIDWWHYVAISFRYLATLHCCWHELPSVGKAVGVNSVDEFLPVAKAADWQEIALCFKESCNFSNCHHKNQIPGYFFDEKGNILIYRVLFLTVLWDFILFLVGAVRERPLLLLSLEKPCRKRGWISQIMCYETMGPLTSRLDSVYFKINAASHS